ncbi:MAG: glutathione S-transferase [Pacificimonas sp.]
MTDLPILYSFRRCPYAMRARMALLVSGTACTLREVKLSDKPAAMIAASEKATVPVVVADGDVIEESLDVMDWALARADPEGWRGRHDDALIAANDGPFKYHLDRYKYETRHDSDPDEHFAAGVALLKSLEARLDGTENLHGDARGYTDIAIFPFVRQFAHADRDRWAEPPLPNVRAWLKRHLGSGLFQAAMVKHPPWQEGDTPAPFPAS